MKTPERVLIVDDYPTPGVGKHPCSVLLEEVLHDHDIPTEVVSPDSLIKKIKTEPHLAIIISSSSVLNPIDLIKRAKEISHRPIGFASMYINKSLREKIAQAGVSYFLQHTLNRNALTANLHETGLLNNP